MILGLYPSEQGENEFLPSCVCAASLSSSTLQAELSSLPGVTDRIEESVQPWNAAAVSGKQLLPKTPHQTQGAGISGLTNLFQWESQHVIDVIPRGPLASHQETALGGFAQQMSPVPSSEAPQNRIYS